MIESHGMNKNSGDSGADDQPEKMNLQEDLKDQKASKPGEAEPAEKKSLEDMSQEDLQKFYDASFQNIVEGEVLQGRIVKVTDSEVMVDVGYKSEGIIDIEEFRDVNHEIKVAPGDEVEVFLEKTEDANGYIVLSKEKAEKMKIWDDIEEAYRENQVITGRVIERIKGGLAVDIGIRAFLPGSQVDIRPVRNLESFRGKELRMRVIKVNKRKGNIVLSRKIVLEKENQERKRQTLTELEEGKAIQGLVKNITEYGAFIDLGGIDGLLHITDMSWGRVSHPSELFSIGDEIEVVVLKFDKENERVSLGYKQRTQDPWEKIQEKYPVSSRVKGKVVSLTDYGAFIELENGIEGLIHISEMSWSKRVKHPSKVLTVGETIECIVLDINQPARRISLGLKQIEPNPWDVIEQKYEIGSKIVGKVRNITNFGAFVEVEEGIDGLIHISDMSWTKRINYPSEVLKKGEEVEAVILNIDKENQRLSLGLKQLSPDVWEAFIKAHDVGSELTGPIIRLTKFGAFVDLGSEIEGLVHVSELSEKTVEDPEKEFKVGDSLRMKIMKIDKTERKISLSVKELLKDEEDEEVRVHMKKMEGPKGTHLEEAMKQAGIIPSAAVPERTEVVEAEMEPPEAAPDNRESEEATAGIEPGDIEEPVETQVETQAETDTEAVSEVQETAEPPAVSEDAEIMKKESSEIEPDQPKED